MKLKKIILLLSLSFFPFVMAFAQNTLTYKVSGANGEAISNAEARLEVLKKYFGVELTSEEIQQFYQSAPQEVSKALEPFGYFHARITSHLSHHGNAWQATFNVNEGVPLTIKQVHIELLGAGKQNKALRQYIDNLPIKSGEVFTAKAFEQIKTELFRIANNQGYIKASIVNNQTLIDIKRNRATIAFSFDTGPQYYFGEVTFNDNVYQQYFLRRFIKLNQQDHFSSEKLLSIQQSLATSFYFQEVAIAPDLNHIENYHVPVRVYVTPPKSQRYVLGVGYGTLTGPRISAGVSLRRVTNSGQHFDAQLKLSSVLSTVAAKYFIPGHNPLTDQWIFGGSYQRFLPKNGSSSSATLTGGYATTLGKVETTANLNYLSEWYGLENQTARYSHLLFPNLTFNYVKTDDATHPTYGRSINLVLRGSSSSLLSSTNFFQSEIKGKYIFSPTSFSKIILRGDLGYTAVQDLQKLPLSLRFFAGGYSTVRGYRDSDIGPGKYLQVASFEYQNHIVGNWSGSVFYDIGAASNDFNRHYKNGTGVGVIYDSMIGPIKVYATHGEKFGFELSIGPEF